MNSKLTTIVIPKNTPLYILKLDTEYFKNDELVVNSDITIKVSGDVATIVSRGNDFLIYLKGTSTNKNIQFTVKRNTVVVLYESEKYI